MLNISIHNLGEVTVFRCAGRVSFGYADTLFNAVAKGRSTWIAVLDLAEVTQIDAAGIGVLMSLRKWAKASGAQLKLMNLTPRVERLLALTRLRSVFETCSVSEMLDLLCRAFEQSQFANLDAAIEGPHRGLNDGEPVFAQSA